MIYLDYGDGRLVFGDKLTPPILPTPDDVEDRRK